MNKILFGLLVLVLLTSSCQDSPTSETVTYKISIEGGNVVNVVTGQITEGQTILLNQNGEITLPQKGTSWVAERKIDAKGKFIIPALWDMHVHFRGGETLIEENKALLPQYLAYGVTTVRDAGGDLTPSIRRWQDEIAQGIIQGPTIYTSGPKIDGPGARWPGSLEVSNEIDVEKALDSLETLQVDFVKLYDSKLSGELYLSILEKASERGLKVSGHMPFTVMLQDAIDRKVSSIEHLYYVLKGCSSREAEITAQIKAGKLGFWGSMSQLIESYDEELAQKRFKNMAENNVYVVPTLHIGHVLSYLDQVNHSGDENLKYIGTGIQETYKGRIKSALSASEEGIKSRHDLHQKFKSLIPKLQKAGVKLLAGSDGGAYNSFVYPGYSLHQELAIMVESGLTPLQALQTSILNGPLFFGTSPDSLGIADGNIVDLLILKANPLEDINNSQAFDGLVRNNQYFRAGQMQGLLTL